LENIHIFTWTWTKSAKKSPTNISSSIYTLKMKIEANFN